MSKKSTASSRCTLAAKRYSKPIAWGLSARCRRLAWAAWTAFAACTVAGGAAWAQQPAEIAEAEFVQTGERRHPPADAAWQKVALPDSWRLQRRDNQKI